MATLTQCLTGALVGTAPSGAGAGMGGVVPARAVLSVLAGAAPPRVPARPGRSAGSSALAALVPTVMPPAASAAQAHGPEGHAGGMARGGAAHATGVADRAPSGMAVFSQQPAPAQPFVHRPATVGHGHVARGKVPREAGPGRHGAKARVGVAHGAKAFAHVAPAVRPHAVAVHTPAAVRGGKGPVARLPGYGGQHAVAALLGHGRPAPAARAAAVHAGVAHRGMGGPHGAAQTRPVTQHAGLMAGVLGLGPAGRATPADPEQYLRATSQAVGFASTVAPMPAPTPPAVQAQITINATGGMAQAIGDELEHRIDTLRLQARQANMGQF